MFGFFRFCFWFNFRAELPNRRLQPLDTTTQLISASPQYSALEALKKMTQSSQDLAALPIIDEQGTLLGEFGVHDLLTLTDPTGLLESVSDYQQKRKKESEMRPIITVSSTDTLGFTLSKILQGHTHRAYVVDEGKLVGVVSLADIFRVLLPAK
jgi:CBS domain-containing protein